VDERDPPAAIRDLLGQLQRRGFAVVSEEYLPQIFGNRLIELEDGRTRVRVICDRLQWFVEVRVAGAWLDHGLLLAALRGEPRGRSWEAEDSAAAALRLLPLLPRGALARLRLRLAAARLR
jgi:hypothetical protein